MATFEERMQAAFNEGGGELVADSFEARMQAAFAETPAPPRPGKSKSAPRVRTQARPSAKNMDLDQLLGAPSRPALGSQVVGIPQSGYAPRVPVPPASLRSRLGDTRLAIGGGYRPPDPNAPSPEELAAAARYSYTQPQVPQNPYAAAPVMATDILRDIGAAGLHAGVRTDVNLAKLAGNLGLNTGRYVEETEALLRNDPNLQARTFTSGPGAQLFQAASESVGPSILTGALAAPLGPLGMLAAPGLMFGGAEYYDFGKDLEKAGIDPRSQKGRRILSALSEAGFEIVGDIGPGKALGIIAPGLKKAAAKGALAFAKKLVKSFVTSASTEVPSEVATAYAQNALRQGAGINTGQTSLEAGLSAVEPTLYSSALFGGIGAVSNRRGVTDKGAQLQLEAARATRAYFNERVRLLAKHGVATEAELAAKAPKGVVDRLQRLSARAVAAKEAYAPFVPPETPSTSGVAPENAPQAAETVPVAPIPVSGPIAQTEAPVPQETAPEQVAAPEEMPVPPQAPELTPESLELLNFVEEEETAPQPAPPAEAPVQAPEAPVLPVEVSPKQKTTPETQTSVAKEPWQMTREELGRFGENLDVPVIDGLKQRHRPGQKFQKKAKRLSYGVLAARDENGRLFYSQSGSLLDLAPSSVVDLHHSVQVRDALKQGKPVPPEVLAEYPDAQPLTRETFRARVREVRPNITEEQLDAALFTAKTMAKERGLSLDEAVGKMFSRVEGEGTPGEGALQQYGGTRNERLKAQPQPLGGSFNDPGHGERYVSQYNPATGYWEVIDTTVEPLRVHERKYGIPYDKWAIDTTSDREAIARAPKREDAIRKAHRILTARGDAPSWSVEKALLYQGPKGAYDPTTRVLYLLKGADISTVIHEVFHAYHANLMSATDDATLQKLLGVKDGKWNKAQRERGARLFERYLRDGKAPNAEVKAVFAKISAWLKGIYKTLKGSDIEEKVSPEVRAFFDKLMGGRGVAPTQRTGQDIKGASGATYRPIDVTEKGVTRTVSFGEGGWVGRISRDDFGMDPARFQFRSESDTLPGVTKWSEDLSGMLHLWRDPDSGKIWVVNGHNRVAKGDRLGTQEYTARFIQGAETAEEARATGALVNIAENHAHPLDAADVFTGLKLTPQQVEERFGVSMQGKAAQEGMALANLEYGIRQKVRTGGLSLSRGILIGKYLPNNNDQKQILNLVAKRKRLTDDVLEAFIQAHLAGDRIEDTSGKGKNQPVFDMGETQETINIGWQRAELVAKIRKSILGDKKVAAALVRLQANPFAKDLGNTFSETKNITAKAVAAQAQELYDRLANMTGPISNALNSWSLRIVTAPRAEQSGMMQDAIQGVLDAIEQFNKTGFQSESGAGPQGYDSGRVVETGTALPHPVGTQEGKQAGKQDTSEAFSLTSPKEYGTPPPTLLDVERNAPPSQAKPLKNALFPEAEPPAPPTLPHTERTRGKDAKQGDILFQLSPEDRARREKGLRELYDSGKVTLDTPMGDWARAYLTKYAASKAAKPKPKPKPEAAAKAPAPTVEPPKPKAHAKPEEMRGQKSTTKPWGGSAQHAGTEAVFTEMGIEIPEKRRQTWQEAVDDVRDNNLDADADAFVDRVNRGDALNVRQQAAILVAANKTHAELLAAKKRRDDALKAGDDATFEAAGDTYETLIAKFADYHNALYRVGSELGRSLYARQMIVREDYSTARVLHRARKNKRAELSPEEAARFSEFGKRIEDDRKQLEEIQARDAEAKVTEAETAANNAGVNREKAKIKRQEGARRTVEQIKKDRETYFNDLKALGQLKVYDITGLTAEASEIVYKIARTYIEEFAINGYVKFADVAGAMRQHLPDLTDRQLSEAIIGPKKKPTPLEAQEWRVKRNIEELKAETRRELEKMLPRSFAEKGVRLVAGVQNFLRSMKASFDVSATGRQGFKLITRHPILGSRAGRAQFKALFSSDNAWKIHLAIHESDFQQIRHEAGLKLTSWNGPLEEREETNMSNLAERLPLGVGMGVKASQRAYATMLNMMRVMVFDGEVRRLERAGLNTLENRKAIAAKINIMSGMGSLSGRSTVNLSAVLFAPRNRISHFQLLNPLFRGSMKLRWWYAQDLLAWIGTWVGLALLGRLLGADVEFKHPGSADFLQLRWGKTRVDIGSSGFKSALTMLSRLFTRTGYSTRPWLEDEKWDDDFGRTIWNYGRYSLAPLVSLAIDVHTGRTAVGEKLDTNAAKGLHALKSALPFGAEMIPDVLKDQPLRRAIPIIGLGLSGAGVQTYSNLPRR